MFLPPSSSLRPSFFPRPSPVLPPAVPQVSLRPDYVGTGGEYRNDDGYLDLCARRVEKLQRACWDEGVNCYIETHYDRITEDPEAFVKVRKEEGGRNKDKGRRYTSV